MTSTVATQPAPKKLLCSVCTGCSLSDGVLSTGYEVCKDVSEVCKDVFTVCIDVCGKFVRSLCEVSLGSPMIC